MPVTIFSQTHGDWSLDPTVPVELRVFALQPYVSAAGKPVSASPRNPGVRSRLNWSVGGPCTITPPASNAPADTPATIVVPAVTVESTTDAIYGAGAQLAAFLFRTDTGSSLGAYSTFGAFQLAPSPATQTWQQVATALAAASVTSALGGGALRPMTPVIATNNNVSTLTFTNPPLFIIRNGLFMQPGTNYTLSGTVATLAVAADSNDTFYAVY